MLPLRAKDSSKPAQFAITAVCFSRLLWLGTRPESLPRRGGFFPLFWLPTARRLFSKDKMGNYSYHNAEKNKSEQDKQKRDMKISSNACENSTRNANEQCGHLPDPGFKTCYPPLFILNLSDDSKYDSNNKRKEGKRENSAHACSIPSFLVCTMLPRDGSKSPIKKS